MRLACDDRRWIVIGDESTTSSHLTGKSQPCLDIASFCSSSESIHFPCQLYPDRNCKDEDSESHHVPFQIDHSYAYAYPYLYVVGPYTVIINWLLVLGDGLLYNPRTNVMQESLQTNHLSLWRTSGVSGRILVEKAGIVLTSNLLFYFTTTLTSFHTTRDASAHARIYNSITESCSGTSLSGNAHIYARHGESSLCPSHGGHDVFSHWVLRWWQGPGVHGAECGVDLWSLFGGFAAITRGSSLLSAHLFPAVPRLSRLPLFVSSWICIHCLGLDCGLSAALDAILSESIRTGCHGARICDAGASSGGQRSIISTRYATRRNASPDTAHPATRNIESGRVNDRAQCCYESTIE